MELIPWLRQEIKQRGWDVTEFAQRANLDPTTTEAILAHQQPPDAEFCYGAAQALEKQPERLLHMIGLLSDYGLKLANELAVGRDLSPDYIHRLARSVSVDERRLILSCAQQRGAKNPLYDEIRPTPQEFNRQERRQDRVNFAMMMVLLLLVVVALSVIVGLILLM